MKRRIVLLVSMAPLLLAGCSLWPAAVADEPTRHVLDARPTVAASARRDLVLEVGAPRAAPGADSAAMVYLQTEHTADQYASHRWIDTPARMLAPLLLRTLEDAGSFRAAVPAPAGLRADLRVDTEVVRLRQSFLARPSRVEITLRVQLLDVAARRVLATRYVEVSQEAPSDDAPGGVVAANAAMARALAQVAAFCVDASADWRSRAP
jgi:cholesterol transport system auxiliary component